jgi:histidinol phosphatase-like enzyme (inositol monophosphatase family)
MPPDRVLKTAIKAAMEAGNHALKAFGLKHRIMTKADSTPVTVVDRECEEILRKILSREFPEDGFFGEEFGSSGPGARARWILDPIDGTKCYIRGIPLWGTLLAREVLGRLTVGVVHLPAMDRLLWAGRGTGAFMNGRRLKVTGQRNIRSAYIAHGDIDLFLQHRALKRLVSVAHQGAILRSLGDCPAYMWVAGGNADAMIESEVAPWDVAAPKIILEEAGGTLTDWNGNDSHLITNVVAANRLLHPKLLKLLKQDR